MMNNFRIFNCSSCWEPQRTTCRSCQEEEEPVQECGCNKCDKCNKCACSEPEITCGKEVCCKPCWDTCKCMDEIMKLQEGCAEVHTELNNIEGRFIRDEKTIQDNYNYLSKIIGDLAEKEERDIQNERNRATGEEQRIENKLDNYIDSNDAALAAEIARAKAAEGNLNDGLQREIVRATTAENTINNSLTSEVTRALAAEQGIKDSINTLERKHDADITEMNNHLDDILGVDAAGISEIKRVLSDGDTATGIIVELTKKADKSNMAAGTYTKVTVNNQGIVTSGSNPNTLAGYGITDAKIQNGTITLGGNSITPLTQHQNISDKANLADVVTSVTASGNNIIVTKGNGATNTIALPDNYGSTINNINTQLGDIINRINALEGLWKISGSTLTPVDSSKSVTAAGFYDSTMS